MPHTQDIHDTHHLSQSEKDCLLYDTITAIYADAALEQTQALIEAGANIHQKTKTGMSFIDSALCKGNYKTVNLLLEHGASITDLSLPIIVQLWDVRANHLYANMVTTLIQKGANIYALHHNGRTFIDVIQNKVGSHITNRIKHAHNHVTMGKNTKKGLPLLFDIQ